jgi:hypothetical protein
MIGTATSGIVICRCSGSLSTTDPDANDIATIVDILHLFGEATRLKTNLQRRNVLPIWCGDLDLELVVEDLPKPYEG